jgi:hypothetical protein
VERVIFALRGAAAYQAFAEVIADGPAARPGQSPAGNERPAGRQSPAAATGPRVDE